MKNMRRTIILMMLSIMLMPSLMRSQELYVGSYNIRYQNDDDTKKGNGWEKRCPVVCGQLNFEHPDIFGAQEVLYPQLTDMLRLLDGYAYIGCGREDGKEKGEYAAIFYDTKQLTLLDDGHFWLSSTPDVPGKGWDAACERICTWGLFEQQQTGLRFMFFNLHLDHVGHTARRESARLVMDRIRELAVGRYPYILTGDFNVDQFDETYRLFADSGLLKDSYEHTRLRFAENGTFNDYDMDRKIASRIDHVFVSPEFAVERYGILTNTYWTQKHDGGKYERRLPSDHYPVFVRLKCSAKLNE